MVQLHGRLLSVSVLTAGLLLPAGLLARADDAASPPAAKPAATAKSAAPTKDAVAPTKEPAAPAKEAAKPKRQLRPELAELRDRVRSVLAAQRQQPFNTRDNSPTEILSRCLAFGCGSDVLLEAPNGQHINGITCLCWNYPCAGLEMLGRSGNHIAARLGYGYQERPGEFLAMLALSRVQPDYGVRLGRNLRKVADLVEAEKLACRSGGDLSSALIGLAYYVNEPEWKNDLGETWSIGRIVDEELAQSIQGAPEGGLTRLMGLSFALAHRLKHDQPIAGEFERAQKYVAQMHGFALRQQNADGSWGPYFLASRGNSQDPAAQLRTTGRVLEWLALSLPEAKLEDAGLVNAVNYLTNLVGTQRYQWNAPMLPTREIVSLGHAVHALVVYDEREFQPTDVEEKPAAEKAAAGEPLAK
jgi:hypothetical protein